MKVALNDLFHEQLSIDARYYYNIGGRWGGRTFGVFDQNLVHLLQKPRLRVATMRKTYESIRRTVFDDWLEVFNQFGLEPGTHYTATTSPLYIRFYNGSDIIFMGANEPQRLKGLSRVHHLILEEANEYTELDFETADNSIRGKNYPRRTYLMHNPVPRAPGMQFWFERLFSSKVNLPVGKNVVYDDPNMGKMVLLKTTYQHNRFCPEETRRRLEGYKETNPDLYKLWTLGDYTDIQGVILSNWDVVDKEPQNVELLGYGLDFGFSVDPDALLRVWIRGKELWVKGLLYRRGLTNAEIGKHMRESGVQDYDTVVADSAEPKSIEELYRLNFRGIKGAKKRANYKADMANVLRGYTIHLVAGDTDLQREFSTWAWAKDKEGRDLPKPADGEDHYMDALIMLMYTTRQSVPMSVADVAVGGLF